MAEQQTVSAAAVIEAGERLLHGNGPEEKKKPSQANLADSIKQIEDEILRFIELESPEIATLLALWLIQSYQISTFAFCGFLSIQSASPRCGKSRLLEILGCFTEQSTPLRTMPTPAVLYRTDSRVLFLDEVDSLRNADKEKYAEVMSLLCVAFKRGGIVERCNKNTLNVERFDAYRAFGFAGLNSLSDALNDRCFPIRMKRTPKKMPRLNMAKLEKNAEPVREHISEWWANNGENVTLMYEALPDETRHFRGLDDRLQDIAESLLVLAMYADAERGSEENSITNKFLLAIRAISGRRESSSVEDGLRAFLTIAEDKLAGRESFFVSSNELVELCGDTDELGWIETTRKLKGFLSKFDLFPKNQGGKKRGYMLQQEWVSEWRKRYG
jgi:hypothetical protein